MEITTKDLLEELSRRMVGVNAAAVLLETHPSYVRRLIDQGKLSSYRLGGRLLLSRTDLEKEYERREARRAKAKQRKAAAAIQQPQTAPPESGYATWTVPALQRELKYRSLPVKGRKAILVARLQERDKGACSST